MYIKSNDDLFQYLSIMVTLRLHLSYDMYIHITYVSIHCSFIKGKSTTVHIFTPVKL